MKLKNEEEKNNIGKRKVVVDIGEDRKAWIENAAKVSGSKISDVFRALIDQAMVQDPENYVSHMDKYKLSEALKDIEREEFEIAERKRRLVAQVEGKQQVQERVGSR